MNRSNLYLVGGVLFSLVAVGLLWNENQALRELAASGKPSIDPTADGGEATALREADKPSTTPKRRPDTPTAKAPPARPGAEPRRPGATSALESLTVVSVPGTIGNNVPEHPAQEPIQTEGAPAVTEVNQGIVAVVGVQSAEPNTSLLKNGGFDKELAPWECLKGRLVRDPENKDSKLLEVSLERHGFMLFQSFPPLITARDLVLSFRVKSPDATEKTTGSIGLTFYDALGKPMSTTAIQTELSNEWATATTTISVPAGTNRKPAKIRLAEKGEGRLWIDDVSLK